MFEYKQIRLQNIRLYPWEGTLYPSVTSVLSILPDPTYIKQWKLAVGERAADRIIDTACARGKYIHAMAEHYFKGNITQAPLTERELKMIITDKGITDQEISFYSGDYVMPDAIPVDEKIKKFAIAFNTFIATHGAGITQTFACEKSLVNERIGVGGKPDWIGVADGLVTLDDFKTSASARIEKSTLEKYFIQVCVYTGMWNLLHPDKKIQRVRIIPFTNARKGGLGEIEEITDTTRIQYYFDMFIKEIFPIFKKLLTNHLGYAEYAFKLHSPMSISPETRQPTGPGILG